MNRVLRGLRHAAIALLTVAILGGLIALAPGESWAQQLVRATITNASLVVTATNLDVQIGGSDTVTVAATDLDVRIGASDTVAVTGAATPSDNFANPTTAVGVMAFSMCWDGATWDRCSGTAADTELPAAAALADNTANPTVPGVAAFLMCFDGTTWDRCPTSSGGFGTIDANTSRVVIASDDDVSDAATLFEANLVAHDAADAGSPLKIGCKATTSIVGQTPVANNDRSDCIAGIDGAIITRPHANLEDRVSGVVGVTDGSSTSLVAAQGAGVRFCATAFVFTNSSATNVTVDIRDGTAGAVILTAPAAANMGGGVVSLQTPLCTTANTAMAMDPSAAATTVTVTAIGFKTEL
jgi:hypothetical protein